MTSIKPTGIELIGQLRISAGPLKLASFYSYS